ncbi:MAG: 2-hydroxyacyl-CoA dehydratase family protein, partial [Synergistaceae bacterium]|nr:2-hydroxyacyl-CoA dehydratase family protein [Synergistaceae bacterium]
MKKNKIDAIIRASRLILRMNESQPSARKSDKLYYDMLVRYYTRIVDAPENGGFVAAHTVFFPIEILYALDIIPMHTETTSWMIAMFLGEYSDLTSAGPEQGLAQEICSPHRGLAGAFALGSIPRPDAMLWSNLVCDNTAKSGELLMEINKCPGFFIDHPFQQTEKEMAYLIEELGDMIRFLEHHSGRKMDYKRFSEVVANADKQIQLYREINELRKAVPSPFNPLGFLQLISVGYLFSGQPEATEYLQTLRDELDADVKMHKGAVAKER